MVKYFELSLSLRKSGGQLRLNQDEARDNEGKQGKLKNVSTILFLTGDQLKHKHKPSLQVGQFSGIPK